MWLICDGPVHQSRRQQIVFGARGVETVDITVYGPRRELHSGHYGNWAPNPALMLARLLASMKDDDGRVLVEHFYDGIEPLSETEKRAVRKRRACDAELKRELWLGPHRRRRARLWSSCSTTLAQHPRHGQRAHRRASEQCDSIYRHATIDMRLVKGIDHRSRPLRG